jgi:hypothetical protein
MYFPVKTIFCSHFPPSYEWRIDHKDKQTEKIVLYGVGVHGEQQRAGEIFVNIEKFDKQTKASVVI